MNEPLELGLKLPGPAVTPEQIEDLVAVLREGGAWMTAAEIAAKIEGVTERSIRKVASAAAPAVVSYPGSLATSSGQVAAWRRSTTRSRLSRARRRT